MPTGTDSAAGSKARKPGVSKLSVTSHERCWLKNSISGLSKKLPASPKRKSRNYSHSCSRDVYDLSKAFSAFPARSCRISAQLSAGARLFNVISKALSDSSFQVEQRFYIDIVLSADFHMSKSPRTINRICLYRSAGEHCFPIAYRRLIVPMSFLYCMPSKLILRILSYALARASSCVLPRAVTPSTLPPEVTITVSTPSAAPASH